MKIVTILVLIGAFVLLVMPLLFLSLHIYLPKLSNTEDPSKYGLKFSDISVKTSDNLNLKGWHIPNEQNKGTIIVCHGVGANRSLLLPVAMTFYSGGYEIYMFDLRGHGSSDNSMITYGFNERKDIKAIVTYLKEQGKKEIGIYGISMGAAIVMLSSVENPEIKALIVDSGYASAEKIMRYRIEKVFPPVITDVLIAITKFYAKLLQNVSIDEIAPIKVIDKINRPILFIIGDIDDLITPDNSKILYEKASEPKELYIIKGVGHNETYLDAGFKKKVIDFMDKNLH